MQARFWISLFLLTALTFGSCRSQKRTTAQNPQSQTIAFYNVENLFDTIDNPDKIDEDFTPEGNYKWTEAILSQKLANIARAIAGIGPNGPAMIGLAEVENLDVVERLVAEPALAARAYKIVHEESPDMRGIDCAFLYDPQVFKLTSYRAFEMEFDEEPEYTSRKVLWVIGTIQKQTLHLVVNHWPSRYGGAAESEHRRMKVAQQIRAIVDSVQTAEPQAAIILMGDFNDDPFDRSIVEGLRSGKDWPLEEGKDFYNPMFPLHQVDSSGTLTYRGKWNLFDQFLLSDDLLADKGKIKYVPGSVGIHRPESMQVGGDGPAKDMPRRAIYRGEFQEGGFSDHFPVYLQVVVYR